MKNIRAKGMIGLVLVMLVVLLYLVYGWLDRNEKEQDAARSMTIKMESITASYIEQMQLYNSSVEEDIDDPIETNVKLMALTLSEIVKREGDAAIQSYGRGFVLRVDESGQFTLPEGQTSVPVQIDSEGEDKIKWDSCDPFRDDEGVFNAFMSDDPDGERLVCAYNRLSNGYYYVYYEPESSVLDRFFLRMNNLKDVMYNLENLLGGYILVFSQKGETVELVAGSTQLQGYQTPDEMGIDLNADSHTLHETKIDGKRYVYMISDAFELDDPGENNRLVYLVPYNLYIGTSIETKQILLYISAVVFLVFTIWAMDTIRKSSKAMLSEHDVSQYLGKVKRTAIATGFCGFIVVFLASIFLEALSGLYSDAYTCDNALDSLNIMIDNYESRAAERISDKNNQYQQYASTIAELLERYPHLKTAENLKKMSQLIGADYLMVYDTKGNEVVSDSRFVGLSFGSDEESTTYDFRRLLSGVPVIIHDPCVDEVTGLNRQLIGVSMKEEGKSNAYGALIVAMIPEQNVYVLNETKIMDSLTTSDSMFFGVDRESGIVRSCTQEELIGKRLTDLGMPEDSLRDEYMDFFTINEQKWYGCSREFHEQLYYYAIKTDSVIRDRILIGLTYALLFLAAFSILAVVVLTGCAGHKDEKTVSESFNEKLSQDTEMKSLSGLSWTNLSGRLHNIQWESSPEEKARLALQVSLMFGLSFLFLTVSGENRTGAQSVISYVMYGRWTHGLNLFAVTKIVILTTIVTLFITAMDLFIGLINRILEQKAITIWRMIASMIRYLTIIAVAFSAFDILGFDTTTILASLGIISLAVSQGAKDLVADMLSGIGIVFSGELQIGEMVDIGGFRGQVDEIGIRLITLRSNDGIVRYISNRNVSNVMNYSRGNSEYILKIRIPYEQITDELEERLKKGLADIGERIDEIIGTPEYKGITDLGNGCATMTVSAICRGVDYDIVQIRLNREILKLFDQIEVKLL